MAQPTVADDLQLPRRGLTRAQYDVLIDAGMLEGEHVELLEGVLAEVAPQGDGHVRGVTELSRWLIRHLEEPWRVTVQSPLAVSDRSEPEPDLAVVQFPASGKPVTAELVVEVAFSSQRTDLVHKPRLYAAAGVPQYWVVDLLARDVVVHTSPRDGGYSQVRRLPWSTPLRVLGVDVDLATLLAGA